MRNADILRDDGTNDNAFNRCLLGLDVALHIGPVFNCYDLTGNVADNTRLNHQGACAGDTRSGAKTDGFAVLGVGGLIRGLPPGRAYTLGALTQHMAQHELPLRHMQLLLL